MSKRTLRNLRGLPTRGSSFFRATRLFAHLIASSSGNPSTILAVNASAGGGGLWDCRSPGIGACGRDQCHQVPSWARIASICPGAPIRYDGGAGRGACIKLDRRGGSPTPSTRKVESKLAETKKSV